jgi:4-hydroxy-2-oxoheptanedioate aldolase
VIKDLIGKVGIWSLINSFDALTALLNARPDYIVLDLEHGYWRSDQLATAILLCRSQKIVSIVRIPSPSIRNFQLAYDSDTDFVQVSGISKASDFVLLQQNSITGPVGSVGFSPWTAVGLHEQEMVPNKLKIILQIETKEILEYFLDSKIEENEHIKMIFVGRYDLSISLGVPGKISDKSVLHSLELCVNKCKELGIGIATVSTSKEDFDLLNKLGVNSISFKSDVLLLRQALKDLNSVGE